MAEKPAFTPGPWRARETSGLAYVVDDYMAVQVAIVHGVDSEAITIANAHLIAAAPAMYKALELLLDAYDSIDGRESGQTKTYARKNARAALDAARGGAA